MNIVLFNDIPLNSIFVWGDNQIFIKTKDAVPDTGMSKQPSNCIRMLDRHKCTMTANHKCIEVIQPCVLPKLQDYDNLKEFEVWMEGYACTGQSAPHALIAKIKAENFQLASYLAVLSNNLKFGLVDGINDFNSYYNPKRCSYWGCECFDNEKDSMYFG